MPPPRPLPSLSFSRCPARLPPRSPQTSGNDCFYRNPRNVEETLFVDVSSPSSSKYQSVANSNAIAKLVCPVVDR